MSCLGVHFAVIKEEAAHLRALPNDEAQLNYLQEIIEVTYFDEHPELMAESNKSWDAMHRALTDGHLTRDGGEYPLNHVVLGGEQIYGEDDYIISLKTPQQVRDIAAALPAVTEAEFRLRYFSIDQQAYGFSLSEEDFGATWEWFQEVRALYLRAARDGRFMLFTADQ